MKTFIVALFSLLFSVGYSFSACVHTSSTVWTTTPDYSSISSCITQSAVGDTINVRAGTAAWTSQLTINKAIKIIGAGAGTNATCDADETCITDGRAADATKTPLISVSLGASSASQFFRFSGFYMDGNFLHRAITLSTSSTNHTFRIDNNYFYNHLPYGNGYGFIHIYGNDVTGVIDSNTVRSLSTAVSAGTIIITVMRSNSAWTASEVTSWANWDNGSPKNVFIEDNTFYSCSMNQGPIASIGAGVVTRYNTFDYSCLSVRTATYFYTNDTHGHQGPDPTTYPDCSLIYSDPVTYDNCPWVNRAALGGEVYGNKVVGALTNANGAVINNNFGEYRGSRNKVFYNVHETNRIMEILIRQAYGDTYADAATGMTTCPGGTLYAGTRSCSPYGVPQGPNKTYMWNNRWNGRAGTKMIPKGIAGGGGSSSSGYPPISLTGALVPRENIEWWKDNSSCNSTLNTCMAGIGCGATLPTCSDVNYCQSGVGFWVPNATWDPTAASCTTIPTASYGANPTRLAADSIKGILYRWQNNQWVIAYSPYTYPHPLRDPTPDPLSISSVSPTAEQQCTGNNVRPSTTLTITTNRATNVTCKWDTTSRADYASLTNTFSGAGTTTHTADLGSKACGTTQTIYYACNCSSPSETTAVASWTFDIKAGTSIKSLFEWATPAGWTSSSGTPLTLGVIWQSTGDGYVTGARFYKNPNDTATTHILKLWTAAGVEMGSVTTSGETSSGWQQANFAAPIAVSASTSYVISYYSSAGYYAYTADYFTTDNYVNAPLSAAKTINGVYHGGNAFPDTVHADHFNYWADLVFEGSAPTPPTPINRTSQYQAKAISQKLSVYTSAAATCKWCKAEVGVCDLNTDYDTMPNTFTNTGGETIHHSADISQSASTSQNYWVRCMDSNLNKNTSSTMATITTDGAKSITGIAKSGGSLTIGNIGSGEMSFNLIP